MDIAQMLKMPVGEKFGGCDVTVKTCGKMWPDKNGWIHQVVITDESGDTLADVNVVKNIKLQRASELHIISGEVQNGTPEVGKPMSKKLRIDQFSQPTACEPEYTKTQYEETVEGKVRHGITCVLLKDIGLPIPELLREKLKKEILYWTKFVQTGR